VVCDATIDADRNDPQDGFLRATTAAVRSMSEGLQQEAAASGYPLRVSLIAAGKMIADGDSHSGALNENGHEETFLTPADVANTILHVISQPSHVDVSNLELRLNGHRAREAM
jgi:NADP-dependent 3-hydroxy acid dehydrogenase YdfG